MSIGTALRILSATLAALPALAFAAAQWQPERNIDERQNEELKSLLSDLDLAK